MSIDNLLGSLVIAMSNKLILPSVSISAVNLNLGEIWIKQCRRESMSVLFSS
jgi:hypothetical protein